MKKGLIAAAIIALVGVILFFSISGGSDKGEKVYAEPAQVRKIDAVVTAPGQVDPKFKVNISANVIGKIEKLYFAEGATVTRGQKLVELEKPSYLAQRSRVRAELANRRIEVSRAKAQLDTAQMAFDRASRLRSEGVQAQELFDRARLELDNAKAAYASAQQGVEQASASIVQAETDLSYTTITSPTDGKVVQLNAREGEVVIPGTMNNPGSVIAVIADLSEILVEAEIGETEVVSIKPGQPATIRVDAVADKEYRGRVTEIGASAAVRASAGGTIRYFKVKVAIEDPDDRLRPGMTSQVSIVTTSVGQILSVPIQSVVERVPGARDEEEAEDDSRPKKKYVFVVDGSKVKMTEVTIGISDALHVAITGGLKAGEQVVTGPFKTLKKLKDGAAVQLSKETSSTSKKEDS